jgi:hypothetical protein
MGLAVTVSSDERIADELRPVTARRSRRQFDE